MSTSPITLPRKLVKRVRRLNVSKGIELASRLGYAARGLVYLGLGSIVLLAALDLTPRAKGAKGVLRAWAEWPLGWALIGAIGLGLAGFAAWRILQAVFDADRHGRSLKAWAVRIGQAISGLVYGGLALFAFELLDEFEDVGEVDEEQTVHHTAGAVLDLPYGDTLLIGAGLVVLAFGVGNVIQGVMQDFSKRLNCDDKRRWPGSVTSRAAWPACRWLSSWCWPAWKPGPAKSAAGAGRCRRSSASPSEARPCAWSPRA
jgi:hypothetical protein